MNLKLVYERMLLINISIKKVRINDFKREFKYLTKSRKAVFIGCILAILFAYFPWFEVVDAYDKSTIMSGFYYKYRIFGIISALFAVISLFILIKEIVTKKTNTFSVNNPIIWMFFSGEAVFALVIAISVFSSVFRDFSSSGFRFGIFFSIISHIVVFISAHFAFLENRKESAKKDFQKISNEDLARINLEPEVSKDQLTLGDQ